MSTPKEIATETINKIIEELVHTKKEVSLTDEEVYLVLIKHIKAAYEEAGARNKNELYRALSIKLHPDKFNAVNPELFQYLNLINMIDAPFKAVNELNQRNLLDDIASDPVGGVGNIYEYISEKIKPMFFEYQRYRQPFKTIAVIASWLVLIPSILIVVVALLIFLIITVIINYADKLTTALINLISQNQYNRDLNEHLNTQFTELKKDHIDAQRKTIKELLTAQNNDTSELDNMSDEALFASLVNQQYIVEVHRLELLGHNIIDLEAIRFGVEQQYNQNIIDEVFIVGLTKLKLVISSLYSAITKPITELDNNKWKSILLIKFLQFLAAPFILAAATIIEVIRYINIAILIIPTATALLSLVASLAIINAPLYVLDFYRYVSQKIRQYASPSSAENDSGHEQQMVSEHNRGPETMLLLAVCEPSLIVHAQESVQYPTVFSTTPTESSNSLDREQASGFRCNF